MTLLLWDEWPLGSTLSHNGFLHNLRPWSTALKRGDNLTNSLTTKSGNSMMRMWMIWSDFFGCEVMRKRRHLFTWAIQTAGIFEHVRSKAGPKVESRFLKLENISNLVQQFWLEFDHKNLGTEQTQKSGRQNKPHDSFTHKYFGACMYLIPVQVVNLPVSHHHRYMCDLK